MTRIVESQLISGVFIVQLSSFADERGRFLETFRKEWFPQRSWEKIQMNRSESKANVLRGLHYHFDQVDYWYVQSGKIRVGLVDLRPSSPTHLATQLLEMDGSEAASGVYIPVGVAHGFFAITDCIHTYVVDSYYDGGTDEYGVAWNDPDLGLDWKLSEPPLISKRDASNPRLRDILVEQLPK
jgi:dTDP-4-dehydrorhamnose 3,5-epimerase